MKLANAAEEATKDYKLKLNLKFNSGVLTLGHKRSVCLISRGEEISFAMALMF